MPDVAQQKKLSPSIERQAAPFFIENFVPPHDSRDTTSRLLQSAAPLLENAKDGSALSLATKAVAIAVMARTSNREHLNQHAARIYGRALAAAQRAMRDPAHATSDETLLAILLFAVYESITSSENSTAAWTQHIEGAIAIVRARGVEQPLSLLDFFRAARNQILTNASHQRNPVQEIPGPKTWLSDMGDRDFVKFEMLRTSSGMPILLNRACSLLSQSDSPELRVQLETLLEDALDAQKNLSAFHGRMTKEWADASFETTSASETHEDGEASMWLRSTGMYKDTDVASARSNTRVNQMLCSSVIIEALKWLHPETYSKDERYQSAKSRIHDLVHDICRTVPFHLFEDGIGDGIGQDVADGNG